MAGPGTWLPGFRLAGAKVTSTSLGALGRWGHQEEGESPTCVQGNELPSEVTGSGPSSSHKCGVRFRELPHRASLEATTATWPSISQSQRRPTGQVKAHSAATQATGPAVETSVTLSSTAKFTVITVTQEEAKGDGEAGMTVCVPCSLRSEPLPPSPS
jgi:hypothetical protein